MCVCGALFVMTGNMYLVPLPLAALFFGLALLLRFPLNAGPLFCPLCPEECPPCLLSDSQEKKKRRREEETEEAEDNKQDGKLTKKAKRRGANLENQDNRRYRVEI